MKEWLNRLNEALKREYVDRPVVMTLATVSRSGAPRARSVICRKIDEHGTIWLVSDSRSKKNSQIRRHRRVELVIWLPSARTQFRIRGKARVVKAAKPAAQALWRSLSDAARALFLWPEPGQRRIEPDTAFPASVSARQMPPETFQAIAIFPRWVEELDLRTHPHQRKRWRGKRDWALEIVNP